MPWSSEKGTPSKPKMDWPEYAASIGPIPLEGPIRYVYDKMRQGGASALDAVTIIKGLIIGAMGGTGLHVTEDYSANAHQNPRTAKNGAKAGE